MKIPINCIAQPKRSVIVDSHTLFHDEGLGSFWMTRPRGDDFLQRGTSDFNFSAISIETHSQEMAIAFESIEHAQAFESWLLYANEEADEGYRTMRG